MKPDKTDDSADSEPISKTRRKAEADALQAIGVKLVELPKDRLAKLGAATLNPSPAAYEERVRADKKAWDPVLTKLDLKIN